MASAVSSTSALAEEFVRFAVERGAIRFGEFTTKAGRQSPYFFNAGLFSDGASLRRLCAYYARALLESGIAFDMLFGPAYKGIVLAAGVAMALAEQGVNVPFAYNRKEAKDHGEGGLLVGAPLRGRAMMVDDVISAGTSVRESMELIRASGAQLAGVVISLDRMERGSGELSAVQEVSERLQIPVISVANLDALVRFLRAQGQYAAQLDAVLRYRRQYGVGVVS